MSMVVKTANLNGGHAVSTCDSANVGPNAIFDLGLLQPFSFGCLDATIHF
jgi:hypothetical protein